MPLSREITTLALNPTLNIWCRTQFTNLDVGDRKFKLLLNLFGPVASWYTRLSETYCFSSSLKFTLYWQGQRDCSTEADLLKQMPRDTHKRPMNLNICQNSTHYFLTEIIRLIYFELLIFLQSFRVNRKGFKNLEKYWGVQNMIRMLLKFTKLVLFDICPYWWVFRVTLQTTYHKGKC